MSGRLATLGMLALIGVRSIGAHKVKSLIVGSLIFFGTALVVLGLSVLDSVEASMEKSVVSSLSGHLQVYSADARDPLALFGSGFMAQDDIGEMEAFERVQKVLESDPLVSAVIPMGIGTATVSNPGELDRAIEALRVAVRDEHPQEEVLLEMGKVRHLCGELQADYSRRLEVTSDREKVEDALEILEECRSQALWDAFEISPDPVLHALDTEIAPLGQDAQTEWLRYLGTDLGAFAQHFDRMEILDGEAVPPGRRGILLSERYFEKRLKHKVARDLDRIERKVEEGAEIAGDPLLEAIAGQLRRQHPRITLQLDPGEAREAEAALRARYSGVSGDLSALVEHVLTIDDATFAERYAAFYEILAPRIELHRVEVGDVLPLRSYTRGGYLEAANVKVWGIFRFQGLEGSDLAGAQNLVDMITFRELLGHMTEERKAELARIQQEVGLEEVSAEDAEAALFGGEEVELVIEGGGSEGAGTAFDEFADIDLEGQVERLREAAAESFDASEVNRGVALHAAILLEDASQPGSIEAARVHLTALVDQQGLSLQIVDWQTAAGMIGQFITVIRFVLYLAIIIIFLVALVIINNSMVLATMERVQEIGTLRAIGAGRRVVMIMFLIETLVLGLVSGAAGAAAGAGLVGWLGAVGITSGGMDVMTFLFSGPRLYPSLSPEHLVTGLVAVLLVSLIATLWPARLATRIQPRVAMERAE